MQARHSALFIQHILKLARSSVREEREDKEQENGRKLN